MQRLRLLVAPILVSAALLLLTVPGCASTNPKAAFFVYDGSDTFITEMMDYITSQIPKDIDYVVHDAGNSQAVQNQQIVGLIGGGYELFVINAVDRLACSSIVEKCQQEGIAVVFFNREPLADALTGSNALYVGAAADSLGEKQADIVAALFGSGGFAHSQYDKNGDGIVQIVILKGEQGHQDAEKRTDNCVSRLKTLGFEVEVLAVESANWRRQEAHDAMSRLYARFGDSIELLFANNDDMALGAIDYLLSIGVFSRGADEQPFPVVSVDGTEVGLEAVAAGLLYGTVNNDSTKQGKAILALLERILRGQDLGDFPFAITNDHYVYIDGEIITRENLDEFTRSIAQ